MNPEIQDKRERFLQVRAVTLLEAEQAAKAARDAGAPDDASFIMHSGACAITWNVPVV